MNKLVKSTKGFTLAELLVVVAIIGVLVGISIPVFSTQLEKSREATDLANVRSAYAQVKTAVITGSADTNVTETDNWYQISVSLKQKKTDWQTSNTDLNVGGIKQGDTEWQGIPKEKGVCVITCNKADGTTTINWNGGTYIASDGISQKIYDAFKTLNNGNYDSNAPDTRKDNSKTGSASAREAMMKSGIDMKAMGAETWRVDKNGNTIQLNVTPVDINGLAKNTQVPVIRISMKDGAITGYEVGVKKVINSSGNVNHYYYDYLDESFSSSEKYSSYNDAVKAINTKLNATGYTVSMNQMPS